MKKLSILTRFIFCWLLPRVALFAPPVWLAISTLEIALADPSEMGRTFWQYNLWYLLNNIF